MSTERWPGTGVIRHRRSRQTHRIRTSILSATAALVLVTGAVSASHQSAAAADYTTPLNAMFYYPWFPQTWHANDHHRPSLGQYSSDDPTIVAAHVAAMRYAGMDAMIASWWGQGHQSEQTRFPQLYAAGAAQRLGVIPYYEPEGVGDPDIAQIRSDLAYLRTYADANPGAAVRIGGKPVIFVYNSGGSNCAEVTKWKAAAPDWYVNMKVFSGFASCPDQPAGWHQYGPASAEAVHLPYSFNISPGFWHHDEAAPRLARDPARWASNVAHLKASSAQWRLVTSFNEWGEDTAVESSPSWQTPSGWGTYLDELHRQLVPAPSPSPSASPSPSPTVSPTPSPTTSTGRACPPSSKSWACVTPSSSPTPSPSPTLSPSPSPTASATPSPTVSPTVTTAPPTTPPAPSPSVTVPTGTPSPSPTTPSPSPTGRSCPAFPAMPDAACTGVPPGVTLHACSSNITASGTYDSCLFTDTVSVGASNVTITRSKVLGIVGGSTYNDPTRNLKLIDVEIDGGTTIDPAGQAAVGGNGYTCLRCHVHRTGRGANAGSNVEIRDSLFYDFGSTSSAHIIAIGSNGGGHSKIVHNSLTCNVMPGRAGGCSAAFSLYGDFDPIDDWLVEQNTFTTVHGYCTYGGSVAGKPYPHATNIRFVSNVFGPCQYGAVAGWELNTGNIWQSNFWADGRPATP